MKIIKFKVSKLFGFLDYDINFDNSDIKIITAPNGYGKTVILNILNSVIGNDFSFLNRIKFENVSLVFDGLVIDIGKFDKSLHLNINGIGEIIDLHDKDILNGNIEDKLFSNELSKYTAISSLFIRDQRISNDQNLVKKYASELRELINLAHSESAKISQELDADFLTRLSRALDSKSSTSIDSLEQRLYGIKDKLTKYSSYDLVNITNISHDVFDRALITNNNMVLLKFYIDDMLLKLSPIEHIYMKIKLFEGIINESILSFKKIFFDREKGFYFIGDNGEVIDYKDLSSGEKNQIILLFSLIFKANDCDIVLIDEPEISLHVSWQSNFIDTILKIKKLNSFENIIISTHSPTIIGSHWDWTCDLSDLLEGNAGDGN
ncbi:AAA family ATPase [Aggregatibacter actinomycetemcomitans]|uniref:AAA family ATPase n=1 Tax=Aggregatibacter actinomycetemcomitans TaxID=714 RepID=UPI00023FF204|nr:AAA family ATPase [Aggregatibacter actinomycetemcomitans]EHK89965.1 putative ATPase [Aggregatibacter actinomycetemcomitans RhAA1]